VTPRAPTEPPMRKGLRQDRSSRSARRLWGALGAVVAAGACALTVAGCGIPLQSGAQAVGGNVTSAILSPPSTTIPTTADLVDVEVYFTSTNRCIVPALRPVNPKAELDDAVAELLLGPTPTEQTDGVQTALGYGTIKPFSLRHSGDVVTVNLSADFGQLSGRQEVLAAAQVVFTVASVIPSAGVLFQLDNAAIAVPDVDGALLPVHVPVRTDTYATLVAPKAGTSCPTG
jgi:hypothetical protein